MKRLLLLVLLPMLSWAHGNHPFESIQLKINDLAIDVEHADSPEERAQGLMHRKFMCDDCGMLFEFENTRPVSFWMKNTFIPLDIAFISATGTITQISPMQPHDLNGAQSKDSVRFALEMHQGWFAEKGIKVGDKVRMHKNADEKEHGHSH